MRVSPNVCGRERSSWPEDAVEPFLAQVVDIVVGRGGESIVHLDVLGAPDETIEELRHAGLLNG